MQHSRKHLPNCFHFYFLRFFTNLPHDVHLNDPPTCSAVKSILFLFSLLHFTRLFFQWFCYRDHNDFFLNHIRFTSEHFNFLLMTISCLSRVVWGVFLVFLCFCVVDGSDSECIGRSLQLTPPPTIFAVWRSPAQALQTPLPSIPFTISTIHDP